MDKETTKTAFLALQSREDVANLLGIKERSLRYFLYKVRPEHMYTSFKIAKANSKDGRQINAPHKKLKAIQRKLADALTCVYTPKVCSYGFIPGKNNADNAQNHVKRCLVLNIDLKDFFSQIHFGRIRGMLMKPPYGIGKEAATTIAQITCYNGKLPQGAPSSPILTNMICVPLDNGLMRLAKETGCTYTRYADDISFSTYRKEFPADIVYVDDYGIHIGKKLARILEKNSFQINPQKVTLRKKSQHQEVTGLTVNVFTNVRREYIRQLRSILDHCRKDSLYATAKAYIDKGFCKSDFILSAKDKPEKADIVSEWFIAVLKGKINYIKTVKGENSLTYLSLAQQLNQVCGRDVFDISALHQLDAIIENNVFILECADANRAEQGSGFYIHGMGLFTSYHVVECGIIYKARKWNADEPQIIATVGLSVNARHADKDLDYAVFDTVLNTDPRYVIELGDSQQLHIGDVVTIVGYPNHVTGNSPNIQTCTITGEKTLFGAPFYTVSGHVFHGASGGVVLNSKYEAVGIIMGGVETDKEAQENQNQGFIPLHAVLDHMRSLK